MGKKGLCVCANFNQIERSSLSTLVFLLIRKFPFTSADNRLTPPHSEWNLEFCLPSNFSVLLDETLTHIVLSAQTIFPDIEIVERDFLCKIKPFSFSFFEICLGMSIVVVVVSGPIAKSNQKYFETRNWEVKIKKKICWKKNFLVVVYPLCKLEWDMRDICMFTYDDEGRRLLYDEYSMWMNLHSLCSIIAGVGK